MSYVKTEEDLENEFQSNKELNKTLLSEHQLPENMTEYIEKLIIENIRSIKFLEKENIPADIRSVRLQYLEKQQQTLLDRLDKLKVGDDSAESF
ncbi:MAG: hypothetical protein M3Q99_12670 [Acidobacteriota bacterium]|nr:hypothetical protein [Acidobacteriota bacterium]